VTVDGRPLALRTSHCLEDWNPYRYGSFEVKGGETVAVTGPDGKTETFVATGPFKRIFDPSRRKDVLVLFGDGPDRHIPDRNDPKVRWFGPGEHDAGAIRLTDGETLYLAPGAVVRGSVYARGRDITVTGRGILTGEGYEKCKGPFTFFTYFDHCTNLVIRGITLTEPYHWTLAVSQSRKILIDDVRLCCGNILNDDGIDLMNASDVLVRDTFVRTQDDNVAIKGMDARPKGQRSPCENIRVNDREQVPVVSQSASIKEGVISLSLSNLDVAKSHVIAVTIDGQKVKDITGEILTAKDVHAYNDFAQKQQVATTSFNDFKLKKDGTLLVTIPAHSVVTLSVR